MINYLSVELNYIRLLNKEFLRWVINLNRKEKQVLTENILLEEIYNLILDKQTTEDERIILIEFKNAVEKGKDFKLQTMRLAEHLRRLALYKFKYEKNLSPKVSKLYMDISSTGLFERELGRGLIYWSWINLF